MSVTPNAEFAKGLTLLAKPAEEFHPTAPYDADGDCIEFLAKPDPFYAERVDDLVTVYYSQETGEVIGSLLKGVSRFCRTMLEKMPGFQIEIQGGRVKLVHIFLASSIVVFGARPRRLDRLDLAQAHRGGGKSRRGSGDVSDLVAVDSRRQDGLLLLARHRDQADGVQEHAKSWARHRAPDHQIRRTPY